MSKTISDRRNEFIPLVYRFLRSVWLWVIVGAWAYLSLLDNEFFQTSIAAIGFVLQLAMYIAFAILQFVAIFWFMARTRTEVILPEDPKAVTFDDYWGQPKLVSLVKQWMSLLSDRDKFQSMGGKFINGILFFGPPGTGKTLLAKACAGTSGIPFISTEGSSFRAMFIGVDVIKVMAFVGKAKKLAREYGACLAYIDEIDAIGASRGGVMGGGQTQGFGGGMGMFGGGMGALTRLLYEMDGIEEKTRIERAVARIYTLLGKKPPAKSWHVLFMGATNRPEVLDTALTRPGRFDQKIRVDAPDKSGRREIIKGYLGKIKHSPKIDVESLVEDTPAATPAQIASAITKDSVRISLFNGRSEVHQSDIEHALEEQRLGIEQPIEEWDAEQRKQVAYHEAGHAVVMHYKRPDQRIVRVSIIRRGDALGYVLPVDKTEQYAMPLAKIAANVMVSMAGHIATKIFMGEYWTGASGDFENARGLLWYLYLHEFFGPPISRGDFRQSPSGKDDVIEKYWKKLESETEKVLAEHSAEVIALAEALISKSELSHAEVEGILSKKGDGLEN